MKYIFTILIFASGFVCFADKPLKKELIEYLRSFNKYRKNYENLAPPSEGNLDVKLQNNFEILEDVLNENPKYINTYIDSILPNPQTTKADRIYCRLLKKYLLSKKGAERKKAFILNLSHCVGTKHTLKLIDEILPTIKNTRISKYLEGELKYRVEMVKRHVAFLNDIERASEPSESPLKVVKYKYTPIWKTESEEEECSDDEKDDVEDEMAIFDNGDEPDPTESDYTKELLKAVKLEKTEKN
ncbi:MAG: hypothetical protein GXP32_00135, partial [Kiritimatiellaeota bacterium]|nr:hypothetical protein [Kiritimatiellota bacterium]